LKVFVGEVVGCGVPFGEPWGSGRTAALARSAHETRLLVVERPAGNKVLHRDCVVAGAQTVRFVERVRALDLLKIDLDPEPGPLRQRDHAAADRERLLGQALAVLPNPVRVDRGDPARRRRGHLREHRQ
jgi:hypothetical protein